MAAIQYLKEAYRKHGERHFIRDCSDWTRGNGLKLKDIQNRYKEGILYSDGGEAPEQVTQGYL